MITRRVLTLLAVLVALAMLLAACGGNAGEEIGADAPAADTPAPEVPVEEPEPIEEPEEVAGPMYDQPIVVGSKDFTEQLLLGAMTVQILAENGYQVDDRTGLGGTTVNRDALAAGQIDVYWEYTGTALVNFLGIEDVITDPDEAYTMARDADVANGLIWLDPAEFNNTYTLMVTEDTIGQGISSIGDLAAAINDSPADWRLCTNAEFYARPDGFRGVEELYGFQFEEENVIAMDSGLTYQALASAECEVAMGFATDGRIAGFGFTNLDDDLGFFPTYNPSAVIREEVVSADPNIGDVLNSMAASLDTATMTELNKRVDIDGEDVSAVACDHLLQSGLVAACN
jgi:osmoprotectant transport system substrate-binding protein